MADIVNVSDSLLKFANKTRLFSDSSTLSDAVVRLIAKTVTKSLIENITSAEDVIEERRKQRLSTDTVTIAETIQLYKNGMLVEPVAEIPTPQNIIGTRERRVRAPRRAPRAIVIDEIANTAIAALKLLAFSDSNNKAIAIVGIRPRHVSNVALSGLSLARSQAMIANSAIKTQLEPMIVKANLVLALASSPQLTTLKLRLRPELQHIESLKAINAERVDKLHKLVTIAIMIENM